MDSIAPPRGSTDSPRPWVAVASAGPRQLLVLLSGLLGLSIVAAALIARTTIDVRTSMTFFLNDGWCSTATEAISGHCWSDFASIRFDALSSVAESPELPYPISARFFRLPFALLEDATNYRVAVIAWLLTLVACAIAPAVWATWRYPVRFKAWAVLVAAVLTMPTLFILERGNTIGLTIPLLMLVAVGARRRNAPMIVVGIVAAAAIKPQFAVLLLIFVAWRWWRPALATAVAVPGVYILSALVAGGSGLSDGFLWIPGSLGWSSAHSLTERWPVNVSFSNVLYTVARPIDALTSDAVSVERLAQLAQAASVVLVALAIVLLMWKGGHLDPTVLLTALFAIASLSAPFVGAHYLAFALIVIAMVFAYGATDQGRGSVGRVRAIVLTFAICASLTPLLIPTTGPLIVVNPADPAPTANVVGSLVPVVASMAWMAFVWLAVVTAFQRAKPALGVSA